MGNNNCQQCKDSTVENYAYGSHEILQQNNRYLAVVQKKVEKDKQLQAKVIKQLQKRKNINNLHITKLQKFKIVEENYGFKTIMYYQYVPKTLRDHFQQVKQKGNYFSQRQLFSIIYGIQQALQVLEKHKIKHHCINLDTILVKNNIYKLSDVSSTTYITSYDLATKGNKQQFLSESLIQKLIHKSLHPSYNLKDDYFSLGIICLLLGTKRHSKDFYSFTLKDEYSSVNIKTIERSLQQMQQIYSKHLLTKIRQLLDNRDEQQKQYEKINKQNSNQCLTSINEIGNSITKILINTSSLNSTTIISPEKNYQFIHV